VGVSDVPRRLDRVDPAGHGAGAVIGMHLDGAVPCADHHLAGGRPLRPPRVHRRQGIPPATSCQAAQVRHHSTGIDARHVDLRSIATAKAQSDRYAAAYRRAVTNPYSCMNTRAWRQRHGHRDNRDAVPPDPFEPGGICMFGERLRRGTSPEAAIAGNQRLYLNGTHVAQMSDTLPIALNSAALGIGRHRERHRRSVQRPYRRVPHRARPALRRLDRNHLEQHEEPRRVRSGGRRIAERRRTVTAGRHWSGRPPQG
jgi:hypothetical protein